MYIYQKYICNICYIKHDKDLFSVAENMAFLSFAWYQVCISINDYKSY